MQKQVKSAPAFAEGVYSNYAEDVNNRCTAKIWRNANTH